MAELGNNIVNKILEGRIPSPSATAAAGGEPALRKPGPESSRPEREAWIFAKYRDRRFVDRDIFQAEEFRHSEAWTVKRLRRRARSQHHSRQQQQRKAGLRIRIRIGSEFYHVSGSGSVFGIRIWIQEAKMINKSRKKFRNFMYFEVLDVLF
jgi:hypothetical protein